jgi:hypothetical protein
MKIEKKVGIENITDIFLEKLTSPELNSWLLELFNRKSKKIKPSKLIQEFNTNRFVRPSSLDLVEFKKEELDWLDNAKNIGFETIILSPLTPFGTCSTVAFVDQNNIVSATRGTEIISDSTNVLAVKAASEIKKNNKRGLIKYCTTHRQVRGQFFTNPAHSAHFGLYCMITAGRDLGESKFELLNLSEHLNYYYEMLSKRFDNHKILLRIYTEGHEKTFNGKLKELIRNFVEAKKLKYEIKPMMNSYYKEVQFKYFIETKDSMLDVADGGFVDWSQKLLSDKKQMLLISAGGLELIIKIKNQQV